MDNKKLKLEMLNIFNGEKAINDIDKNGSYYNKSEIVDDSKNEIESKRFKKGGKYVRV